MELVLMRRLAILLLSIARAKKGLKLIKHDYHDI